VVIALAAGLLVVTLAVLIDHGSPAARLDLPVERWVIARRSVDWTAFFRGATHLGDPGSAFAGGLVLSAAAAFRSPRVAVVLLLIALVRPLTANVLKDVVGRPRPQLSQLVTAAGDAFPSGHTLAACVFWGALPAVLAVWSTSRVAVRTAAAVGTVLVVLVACSRVYLGVHWLTDVLGGALLGLLLLVPLYRTLAAPVPTMDP
jgi:membrane-associated phospholipid phosphatase